MLQNKKFYQNILQNLPPKNLCICKDLSTNSIVKLKFLKQSANIRFVIGKLSKCVQISIPTSQIPFIEDSLKIKKGLELVSRSHFRSIF